LNAGERLLDAGTGTGGIASEALKKTPALSVVGVDFSFGMMQAGRALENRSNIRWCAADAIRLPFKDESFDAITSGYLIRNVRDRAAALSEQVRVVKTGGRVVCLDTSPPTRGVFRPLILFFFNYLIPFTGRLVSKHRSAYTYLPESTKNFLTPHQLAQAMRKAGLVDIQYRSFMFGTMSIHVGIKA
jgi:demethylmenaquinone methyltransferase/2-methoxy-6-polyprenyl-1,4-benzoquinol methylase